MKKAAKTARKVTKDAKTAGKPKHKGPLKAGTWKKNSPETVSRFNELCAVPGAERGVMFGCPIFILSGTRYASLNQDQFVLRLSPDDATSLIDAGGRPFEAIKGRIMKDRFIVPEAIATNNRSLKKWVAKAAQYASER